jgi:uncharacterized membrane protein YecN with MAPEG domain
MNVTPLYAGILAILFFALSLRVIAVRGRVSLGDGGDPVVLRRMRGHANFAEYVPLILLMMGFLELNQVSATLLHGMGLTLVAARLLHGYALSFAQKSVFGRFVGTFLTLGLLLVGGGLCVFQGLRAAGMA